MNTIDQAHSVHYAVGYMFDKIQPRLAMVTHMSFDEELVPEIVAGIRHHYNGLFQFGAPDVVVVNVNKDAIWTRKAVIPDAGNMSRPSPREAAQLFDLSPDEPQGDVPDAAAHGCRRRWIRTSSTGRSIRRSTTRRICIASRSPTSRRASRSMSARSPLKLRHIQEKLAAKQDQLQHVVDAIEQASS